MVASPTPTTLFPNGLSNAPVGSTLETLMMLDPFALHSWSDDFDAYTSGGTTAPYTATGTDVAVSLGAAATYGQGGWLLVGTTTATGAIGGQIQLKVASYSFVPPSGVPAYAWFKTSLQIADVTNSAIAAGLMEEIVPTTALPTYTDGVWFQKAATAAAITINAKTGGTAVFTPITVATMVANTTITLGYFWNGVSSTLNVYVNDVNLANIPNISLTTAALSPTIACFATTAAAQQVAADYLMAATLRQPLS